jgi:hypothetical protein
LSDILQIWTDIMTQKLRKAQVAARYGGVNPRTIDRWTRNKELGFPQPTFVGPASKRRPRGSTPLWDEAELVAWERERARPAAAQ